MDIFQDKMNLLEEISLNDVKNKRDLLEVFSYLVWGSRTDYQYNETYLRDFIPDFEHKTEIFHHKLSFINKLFKRLKSLTVMGSRKVVITLDNIWEIAFDKCWSLDYTEDGNLFSLSNNHISIDIKIEWSKQKFLDYFMKVTVVDTTTTSENSNETEGKEDTDAQMVAVHLKKLDMKESAATREKETHIYEDGSEENINTLDGERLKAGKDTKQVKDNSRSGEDLTNGENFNSKDSIKEKKESENINIIIETVKNLLKKEN